MLTPDARMRARARFQALDRRIIAAGAAGLIVFVGYIVTQPDGKLHVTFLNVGHGDAVLVQTPTGSQVLIDGGPDPRQTLSQLGDHLPFWDRSLDLVILTSPDASRLTGLVPVLTRYDVAAVAVGPEEGDGTTWEAWRAAVQTREDDARALTAGVVHELDGEVKLHVLWPPQGVVGPVVLRIEHPQVKLLLMGDATTRVEEALVTAYAEHLRSDVLQLARQGAQTSTTVALLQAVSPDVAVVSRGERFDLSPYIEARLMEIPLYRTDRHGAIRILSDGHAYRVRIAKR
jgi:competence protein ComEC